MPRRHQFLRGRSSVTTAKKAFRFSVCLPQRRDVELCGRGGNGWSFHKKTWQEYPNATGVRNPACSKWWSPEGFRKAPSLIKEKEVQSVRDQLYPVASVQFPAFLKPNAAAGIISTRGDRLKSWIISMQKAIGLPTEGICGFQQDPVCRKLSAGVLFAESELLPRARR